MRLGLGFEVFSRVWWKDVIGLGFEGIDMEWVCSDVVDGMRLVMWWMCRYVGVHMCQCVDA